MRCIGIQKTGIVTVQLTHEIPLLYGGFDVMLELLLRKLHRIIFNRTKL